MRTFEAKALRRQHAIERYNLHYSGSLTPQDYESLCASIRQHHPDRSSALVKFLCNDEHRRITHWALQFRGQWVVVVYNHNIRSVTTFLPSYKLWKGRYRDIALRHGLPNSDPVPAKYNLSDIVNQALAGIIITD